MFALGLLTSTACLVAQAESPEASPWVLVDSKSNTLTVMERGRPVQTFRDIALGRGGVAAYRRAGDGKTPRGEFRVAWVNPASPYHLFFGLDYPGEDHAAEAYQSRLIDADTYERIRLARARGELPPQDTALGGYIGIHGVGTQAAGLARRYDRTQGCIALSDDEIERLAHWVWIGTRVVIR